MNDPMLLKLVAPTGETRMIDVHDITDLDRAWILESFPDAVSATPTAYRDLGYVTVNVATGRLQ